MTIDERVASFMALWVGGVHNAHEKRSPDLGSAYEAQCAGRAAYLAAEKAERERLEKCPTRGGEGFVGSVICPACAHTGKRQ